MANNKITINFTPCTPAPANGYRVLYRPAGSTIPYRNAGNFTSSPIVINDTLDAGGTDYEGVLQSQCGTNTFGVQVPFTT